MAWNTDAVNQQMNTNPALRAELQNAWALNENAGHNPTADAFRAAHPGQPFESWMDVMKRYGIDVPPQDYRIKINPDTGEFRIDRDSFWQRNKDWLEPSIAAGALVTGGLAAPAIAGALGGTAAAGGATSGAAAASAIPTTAGISGATALGLPVTAAPAFAGLTGAAAIPTVTGLTGAELGAGVTGADFAANAISPGADPALASHPTVPNAGTLPTGTSPQGSGVGHDPTSYESILKELLKNSGNNGTDWTSLLLGGVGSALNAWSASQNAPQKRQSFRGTTADPVDLLSGAMKAIGSEAHTLHDEQGQAGQLVAPANPGSLPTFTGGGLPMPIGVRRNTAPPIQPLSSQPATSDELDHLYSSLSLLGGKR
jgi:hypothetical protein